MTEAQIVAASEDDLVEFAPRRCRDAEERALWAYLVESAPGGAWVARDQRDPIGLAFAHRSEDEWLLSELFVEPSFRRQGIGKALLRAVAEPAVDFARAGIVDFAEPGGVALFGRCGLPLIHPLFRVSGAIPDGAHLARLAAGDYRFEVEPLERAKHGRFLDGLDRRVRGWARPDDHRFFSERSTGLAFTLEGEFVAYAYIGASGRVGPLATAAESYVVQVLAYAMHALSAEYSARWMTALIPGRNTRALRALLKNGLAVEGSRIFAADQDEAQLTNYIGFHERLF